MFEWGSLRKKNADSAMGKHIIILALSALSVFLTGFALAFGEP
jgi:ammonia channel protein AmtB